MKTHSLEKKLLKIKNKYIKFDLRENDIYYATNEYLKKFSEQTIIYSRYNFF